MVDLSDLSFRLYGNLIEEEHFPQCRPLLAHYTTMQNLENILSGKQLWLSNPLFMNDYQEVAFGVNHALGRLSHHEGLKVAFGGGEQWQQFLTYLNELFGEYGTEKINDLYVASFSRVYDQNDMDGLLSMWRGYGNDGRGVSLVFDTERLTTLSSDFPLVLAPISYLSIQERSESVDKIINEIIPFVHGQGLTDADIRAVADQVFQRFWVGSIFSKHIGFSEEREWRLAYLPERDSGSILKRMIGYDNSHLGIMPKLKLKFDGEMGILGEEGRLSNAIHKIIVGPAATSSPVQIETVRRMLKSIGETVLCERVVQSTIPYRSRS